MFQRFARSEHLFVWKNAERWPNMPAPMVEIPAEMSVAAVPITGRRRPAGGAKKPRCEDCFFHQNMLCALQDKRPCPTFRPAHPDGLRPPQQLSFVFRQERHEPAIGYLPPVERLAKRACA